MNKQKSIKKIKQTADFHARSLVTILQVIGNQYGEEDIAVFKKIWLQEQFHKPWRKLGRSVQENDVQTLSRILEEGCYGTHEWEKIIDEPNRIGYRFTKCRWAEIFTELEAMDIGKWFCDADPIIVKAFNPKIKFERTKTLMDGDDCCDHLFIST